MQVLSQGKGALTGRERRKIERGKPLISLETRIVNRGGFLLQARGFSVTPECETATTNPALK